MKRLFMILLSLLMVTMLFGCGSKEDGGGNDKKEETLPSGIWVLRYIGNDEGEYVEEFNMTQDFYGNMINIIEMATVDYGEIAYLELDENGKGTYYNMGGRDPVEISFTTDKVIKDGVEKDYKRKGNRLWFPEDDPVFNEVFENVSEEMLAKIKRGAYDCVDFDKAEIGDLIALGEYEMSPGNDHTEPIKWRVIDKDDDRLFVLCDKLIDSFSFNHNPDQTNLDAVTWENSSIRAFLNDPTGFLSCFSEDEIAMMEMTHNQNKAANEELLKYWGDFEDKGEATYSDLARQNMADEADTDDRIFLLSFQEVEKYFGEANEPSTDTDYPFSVMPRNEKWIAYVTKAVQDNGTGYFNSRTGGGAWMTRTLSQADEKFGNEVTYISGDGQVFNYFTYVPLFIRPAMWIKIK